MLMYKSVNMRKCKYCYHYQKCFKKHGECNLYRFRVHNTETNTDIEVYPIVRSYYLCTMFAKKHTYVDL